MAPPSGRSAYGALFETFSFALVGYLQTRLTEEDLADSERLEVQEKRLISRPRRPSASLWDDIDLDKALHLVETYRRRLLPPTNERSIQLKQAAQLQWSMHELRQARKLLSHVTVKTVPSIDDAIRYVEAAQALLGVFGLSSNVLRQELADLRGVRRSAFASYESVDTHLPHQRPALGRNELIRDVTQAIRRRVSRIVFLTGQSGIGKTTIATAVARSLTRHFKGRVAFLPLDNASDCSGLLSAIAATVSRQQKRQFSIDDLAKLLGRHSRLIVLDNFEVLASCATVLGDLSKKAPNTVFLCTSTEPPDIAVGSVMPIKTLPVPAVDDSIGDIRANPSVELFIRERHVAGGPPIESDSDLMQMASICRRLDGLPLALELVARQSAAVPLSLIADELTEFMRRPSGLDRPRRHQTVDASIEWTMLRLTNDEMTLLKDLSVVLHHPIALRVLALTIATSDISPSRTIDLYSQLVKKGLLHLSANRVFMLDIVRDVVIRRLSRRRRTTVERAYVEVLFTRLRSVIDDQSRALEGDLEDLPQLCLNSLPILVFADVPTKAALRLLLSWAQLSWVREGDFGRYDLGLAGMLVFYATRDNSYRGEAILGLIEAARLEQARGQTNAYEQAAKALELAIAARDVKLAQQAAAVFDEATRGNPARPNLYRQAISKVLRSKLNRVTQTVLEDLLDTPVSGSREDYEVFSEISGRARQRLARKLIAARRLAPARIHLFRAIDDLLPGSPLGPAGRRLWRAHLELARTTKDLNLITEVLNGWCFHELGFGEFMPEQLVSAQNLPWRPPTAQLRFARRLALQAAIRPSEDTALLIGGIALLSHDHALAGRAMQMLASTATLNGQHLSNALELADSILAVIGLDSIEAVIPAMLERAGRWLIDNGNPIAGYAIAVRLNVVIEPRWLTKARRRLDRGERAAAERALKSAPWPEAVHYARAEVGRVTARERKRRLAEMGIAIKPAEAADGC